MAFVRAPSAGEGAGARFRIGRARAARRAAAVVRVGLAHPARTRRTLLACVSLVAAGSHRGMWLRAAWLAAGGDPELYRCAELQMPALVCRSWRAAASENSASVATARLRELRSTASHLSGPSEPVQPVTTEPNSKPISNPP